MTQAKHTPEPWTFNADNFDGVVRTTERTGPHTARYKNIAENVSGDNARLIAVALEMLQLLRDINDAFYAHGTRKALLPVMQRAKPLIRKATGEA